MLTKLLPLIPQGGDPFCEPYAGSLTVLFARPPAQTEAVNDVDLRIVNLYRVLKDAQSFLEFKALIAQTLFSRAEFARAGIILQTCNTCSPVVKAWSFFTAANQGMIGTIVGSITQGRWGRTVTSGRGLAMEVGTHLRRLHFLDYFHSRLQNVAVESEDALSFIRRYDSDTAIMYVDPPYISTACKYNYHVDEDHHRELIDLVLSCKSAIVLSHYVNPMYEVLANYGWQKIEFPVTVRMGNIKGQGQRMLKQPRVECVWRNPKAVALASTPLLRTQGAL